MANKKVSQLPEYTGDTYNGYFVWNDSGETTTYKTKFNNTFYNVLEVKQIGFTPNINVDTSYGAIALGGNNNIGSTDKLNFVMGFDNNVSGAGAPDAAGSIVVGRGNNLSSPSGILNLVMGGYNSLSQGKNIRFGNNGSNTGGLNIDGGEQNNISGSNNIAWGDYISVSSDYNLSLGFDNDITSSNGYNAITNGKENDIIGTTEYGAIVSSSGSTINNLDRVVILGLHGFSATTSATTYVDKLDIQSSRITTPDMSLYIGTGNTITANSLRNFVVGNDNSVGTTNKKHYVIGNNNNVTGGVGTGGDDGAFVFGNSNTLSSSSLQRVIVIGSNNTASDGNSIVMGENNNGSANGAVVVGGTLHSVLAQYGVIIGGYDNDITNGDGSSIFGGAFNDITGSGDRNQIIGGRNNLISGTGNRNTIISGSASTINNLSDVVILGLNGFSATTSATTYVDNIEVISKVILTDYANLDYADDAAADAGGIPLGGVYHTSGALKVRIT